MVSALFAIYGGLVEKAEGLMPKLPFLTQLEGDSSCSDKAGTGFASHIKLFLKIYTLNDSWYKEINLSFT